MPSGTDTEQVSLAGFQGVFPPANGPLSKASELYVETDYPKYDIAKAEALHQEYIAEYGEPLTFSAIVPPITEYINVAESIRLMGEPYGLQVEIRQLDQPSIVNALVTGDYTSSGTASQGRILFTSPLPDADYVFIASEPKAVGEVSLNFARFDNPGLRQCLDDFRKIPLGDIEAQKPAAKCVQDELAKSLQYIWLVEIRNAVIYQNSVHGFTEQTAPDGEPLPTSPNPFYYNIWVKR